MITLRQIERLWNERKYAQMSQVLASGRSDIPSELLDRLGGVAASAALAVIRLDELAQNDRPLALRMIRAVLACRQPDGGWGDPLITTLAVRALRCARGQGLAVVEGMRWLAVLQKPEGAWPVEPVRRLPADALTTAFVLLHLGTDPLFTDAARLDDAVDWLARHRDELDAPMRRLAERVCGRCRVVCGRVAAASGTPLFVEPIWC